MIKTRTLGRDNLQVSGLGLGVMMLPDNKESVHTIQGALDAGVTMVDTADFQTGKGRFCVFLESG